MRTVISKKQKELNQAVANERLENLKVSKETLKLAGNYVSEKASLKDVSKQIRARYGAI
jgi:hypothetical protein